jgi:hypothetical protein
MANNLHTLTIRFPDYINWDQTHAAALLPMPSRPHYGPREQQLVAWTVMRGLSFLPAHSFPVPLSLLFKIPSAGLPYSIPLTFTLTVPIVVVPWLVPSNTTSCKPYSKKLKIMTLPYIYIYEILLYIKMSLSKFKTNSMLHSHDTRNKSDLFITSHNTKLFKQSTAYNGVLVYTKLHSEIKSDKSIIKFKKILRNFLLEKSFYSVEEFMTVDY